MGIDAYGGYAESEAEDQVCRFASHAREGDQSVDIRWDRAAVIVPNDSTDGSDVLGLRAIKAGGINEL